MEVQRNNTNSSSSSGSESAGAVVVEKSFLVKVSTAAGSPVKVDVTSLDLTNANGSIFEAIKLAAEPITKVLTVPPFPRGAYMYVYVG